MYEANVDTNLENPMLLYILLFTVYPYLTCRYQHTFRYPNAKGNQTLETMAHEVLLKLSRRWNNILDGRRAKIISAKLYFSGQ